MSVASLFHNIYGLDAAEATIRERQVEHLVYIDDPVLMESAQSELDRVLDGFHAVCAGDGLRISEVKLEVREISRNLGNVVESR